MVIPRLYKTGATISINGQALGSSFNLTGTDGGGDAITPGEVYFSLVNSALQGYMRCADVVLLNKDEVAQHACDLADAVMRELRGRGYSG
jgi:hypothetical protein